MRWWLSLAVNVFRKVISLNLYCKGWKVVMVCQAASQTRFRALKHENGIAGSSTIIVRVIACFQPLRECQAEYFRQLLKPVT
ncbi:transcription factor BHLH021 [Senna tora]|uniref:Transcription factor BHLH021 n=1 Tax=Senna tora TaxID=362788 RepID=A0A834WDH1_9FABA|nr:transcription factor BHLH021 [Senna tora]